MSLALLWNDNSSSEQLVYTCLAALIAPLLISIICIIHAFVSCWRRRKGHNRQLNWGLGGQIVLFKFLMMPYFIVTFLLIVFMVFFLSSLLVVMPGNVVTVPLLWFVASILLIFGYFFLLATSSYSITAILSAYSCRSIRLPECIAFIVLQLVFVTDVISYPFIVHTIKKRQKGRKELFEATASQ